MTVLYARETDKTGYLGILEHIFTLMPQLAAPIPGFCPRPIKAMSNSLANWFRNRVAPATAIVPSLGTKLFLSPAEGKGANLFKMLRIRSHPEFQAS